MQLLTCPWREPRRLPLRRCSQRLVEQLPPCRRLPLPDAPPPVEAAAVLVPAGAREGARQQGMTAPPLLSVMLPKTHVEAGMTVIPAFGALARCVGPLYGAYVYDLFQDVSCSRQDHYVLACGSRPAELGLAAMCGVVVVLLGLAYRGLKPIHPCEDNEAGLSREDSLRVDSFRASVDKGSLAESLPQQ